MLILQELLKPKSILIVFVVSAIMFSINYYIMSQLPGYRDYACVIGAGLKPSNIIFSILLSLLTGIFVASLFNFKKIKVKHKIKSSASGALGLFLGNFTIFCPLCLFPALSLFGLSISLSFFTTYDIWIKIISIILMLFGLYLLNKKLQCNSCNT